MESQQNLQVSRQDDEMSLKDLILKLKGWWKFLLSKWLIIVLFGLLGAGGGLLCAFLSKPDYVARLTFVVEESSSNPLSSYAGLASQFGLDLSGGGSDIFSGENILEFLKTRLMIEKTLLSPIQRDGKITSLADLYLDIYDIRTGMDKKPELKGVHLPSDVKRSTFTVVQDSLLSTIYEAISKNALKVEKPDKKLSFVEVKVATQDEQFSKVFTERLVKEAINFYVSTKTQRSKSNVDKLQDRADSLEVLLNKKTYSAAVTQDFNINPSRRVATVSSELVSRDKMVLQTMYAEVVKNLELSRITMTQETPVIQIVDVPILPLKKEKLGKAKGLVAGGVIGGFFIVVFLTLGRLYKEVMN